MAEPVKTTTWHASLRQPRSPSPERGGMIETAMAADPLLSVLCALEATPNGSALLPDLEAAAVEVPEGFIDFMVVGGWITRVWGGDIVRIAISPRGWDALAAARMRSRLESIASALPQSEQAEWMVRTAREGLARTHYADTAALTEQEGSGS